MKRLISFALLMALILGLCACGEETPEEPQKTLQVGFGRVNITPSPTVGVLLDGYDDRWSTGVLNPVYATCVAITDENDNTILLYTLDMTNTEKETVKELRTELSTSTGIPGDHITISGTHTHSSPAEPYADNYVYLLVQAGEDALADRSPATAYGGTYNVPNMNFDRHYVMKDGSMKGDNYGDRQLGYQAYASQADSAMRLIRFVREGNKKDVVMVNWQVHPKLASTADTAEGKATRDLISSDFIGYARDYTESREEVLFAYFTGAAGNVNPFSKLDAEKDIVTKEVAAYGQQFGQHVLAALAQLTPLETGAVRSKTAPLGDRGYQLHAYTVGSGIGFATVPAEIFHQTGTQIREGSPTQITFVLTVANGRDTYIPIDEAWDYYVSNGQTPYEVRICRYPRGTAEMLAQTLGEMLTELART